MIDRRNFAIGATLAVVGPTIQLLPCPQETAAASLNLVTLVIHGWRTSHENSVAEEVGFRVDRSWRVNWR